MAEKCFLYRNKMLSYEEYLTGPGKHMGTKELEAEMDKASGAFKTRRALQRAMTQNGYKLESVDADGVKFSSENGDKVFNSFGEVEKFLIENGYMKDEKAEQEKKEQEKKEKEKAKKAAQKEKDAEKARQQKEKEAAKKAAREEKAKAIEEARKKRDEERRKAKEEKEALKQKAKEEKEEERRKAREEKEEERRKAKEEKEEERRKAKEEKEEERRKAKEEKEEERRKAKEEKEEERRKARQEKETAKEAKIEAAKAEGAEKKRPGRRKSTTAVISVPEDKPEAQEKSPAVPAKDAGSEVSTSLSRNLAESGFVIRIGKKEYTKNRIRTLALDAYQYDMGGNPENVDKLETVLVPEEKKCVFVVNGTEKGEFDL